MITLAVRRMGSRLGGGTQLGRLTCIHHQDTPCQIPSGHHHALQETGDFPRLLLIRDWLGVGLLWERGWGCAE